MNPLPKLPRQALIHCQLTEGILGNDEHNRLGPMTAWLGEHAALFRDKRVLDLGSNAGHFPLVYALRGASAVTAVEPRKVFADFFQREIRPRVTAAGRVSYITADVRDFVPFNRYEVLSCLGLLYHVQDGWAHLERLVRQSGATTLIFDSQIWPSDHKAFETARSNTNCARLLERVPHPSFASVEAFFNRMGWQHQLVLKNWPTVPLERGLWLVQIPHASASLTPGFSQVQMSPRSPGTVSTVSTTL